jgi:hypothetical protein
MCLLYVPLLLLRFYHSRSRFIAIYSTEASVHGAWPSVGRHEWRRHHLNCGPFISPFGAVTLAAAHAVHCCHSCEQWFHSEMSIGPSSVPMAKFTDGDA